MSANRPLREVAVHDLALLVSGFRLQLLDFRIDVTVDEKQIEPAVAIEIEEPDAPAEPARVHADSGRERAILAQAAAGIRVERRGIAGEVRLEDVHPAVAVVVAHGHAHPRLRLAVLAVRAARPPRRYR